MVAVLATGVLGRRHGGRGRQHREVVEARERRLEVEDDGVVIRGLNGSEGVGVLARVRRVVLRDVREQVVEVGRAVREGRLVHGPSDAVLHVLGRDDGAVLELDALADLVGPRLAAVARHTEGLGEVGDKFVTGVAGSRLEGDQGAAVVAQEVPREAVVGVARVDGVEVVRHAHAEGATLDGARLVDSGHGGVLGAVGRGGGRVARARAARGRSGRRCRRRITGRRPERHDGAHG